MRQCSWTIISSEPKKEVALKSSHLEAILAYATQKAVAIDLLEYRLNKAIGRGDLGKVEEILHEAKESGVLLDFFDEVQRACKMKFTRSSVKTVSLTVLSDKLISLVQTTNVDDYPELENEALIILSELSGRLKKSSTHVRSFIRVERFKLKLRNQQCDRRSAMRRATGAQIRLLEGATGNEDEDATIAYRSIAIRSSTHIHNHDYSIQARNYRCLKQGNI